MVESRICDADSPAADFDGRAKSHHVMPGLVPGIHALLRGGAERKTWMVGTSPAMTMAEIRE
jgi:hypothetical protein